MSSPHFSSETHLSRVDDFHARSRFAPSTFPVGKWGPPVVYSRADQTTYDPKRLRWNRKQECENYGAEKRLQRERKREGERAARKTWSDANITAADKANWWESTRAPNENIVQNHLNIALLNVF